MMMLKLVLVLFLQTLVLTDAGAPPFSGNDLRCNAAMQDILGQMKRIVKAKVYELNGWVKSRNYIFKIFNDVVDYDTARARCNELGGRLATEILRHCETVRFLLAANYVQQGQPWIGYDDRAAEGNWVWSDGGSTDSQTTGWNTNEPNSYLGQEEDCVHLVTTTDSKVLMNDRVCTERHTYICEINTDHL